MLIWLNKRVNICCIFLKNVFVRLDCIETTRFIGDSPLEFPATVFWMGDCVLPPHVNRLYKSQYNASMKGGEASFSLKSCLIKPLFLRIKKNVAGGVLTGHYFNHHFRACLKISCIHQIDSLVLFRKKRHTSATYSGNTLPETNSKST